MNTKVTGHRVRSRCLLGVTLLTFQSLDKRRFDRADPVILETSSDNHRSLGLWFILGVSWERGELEGSSLRWDRESIASRFSVVMKRVALGRCRSRKKAVQSSGTLVLLPMGKHGVRWVSGMNEERDVVISSAVKS